MSTIPTISQNRLRQFDSRSLSSSDFLISSPRISSRFEPILYSGDWLESANEHLSEIAQLGPGWDSYGGDPPSADAIEGARSLLLSLFRTGLVPKPHIYPARGGGIQLEWEVGQKYLEIETLSDTNAEYFYSDPAEQFETEGVLHAGGSLDDVLALILNMCE